MSQYSHLPIYNAAFIFLRELYQRVPKFNKQYKYVLGQQLLSYSIATIRLIIKANNERSMEERRLILATLIETIELLGLHCRIAEELHQWGSNKAYLYLMEKTADLLKQAEGWKKSTLTH
jgi:hypothetical protein